MGRFPETLTCEVHVISHRLESPVLAFFRSWIFTPNSPNHIINGLSLHFYYTQNFCVERFFFFFFLPVTSFANISMANCFFGNFFCQLFLIYFWINWEKKLYIYAYVLFFCYFITTFIKKTNHKKNFFFSTNLHWNCAIIITYYFLPKFFESSLPYIHPI